MFAHTRRGSSQSGIFGVNGFSCRTPNEYIFNTRPGWQRHNFQIYTYTFTCQMRVFQATQIEPRAVIHFSLFRRCDDGRSEYSANFWGGYIVCGMRVVWVLWTLENTGHYIYKLAIGRFWLNIQSRRVSGPQFFSSVYPFVGLLCDCRVRPFTLSSVLFTLIIHYMCCGFAPKSVLKNPALDWLTVRLALSFYRLSHTPRQWWISQPFDPYLSGQFLSRTCAPQNLNFLLTGAGKMFFFRGLLWFPLAWPEKSTWPREAGWLATSNNKVRGHARARNVWGMCWSL